MRRAPAAITSRVPAPSADPHVLRALPLRQAGTTAVKALLSIAGATLLLTGCSSPTDSAKVINDAPVIVPGKPGEVAATLTPGQTFAPLPSPTINATDVRYVQDMIVHHRQALEMAALAPDRAQSARLKSLADRIYDAQGPEIKAMTTWLEEEGLREPDHHADHATMPGMATPAQLTDLRNAKGESFDTLFVTLMIAHHKGAITMAETQLINGSHDRVLTWAQDVVAEQSAEITRLQRLLG
ncbi:DUF305 domain-containing protein [Herbidospora sp. NBRC 101105]|uniref:DUF305 domain-containing protein n=1 Tax=Herbidospora sp. NBRC 101105 TaxID=3032195 RepID=UPI0024A6097D|nr:DUF305 domain-containing protein [Herbidospora sp. NBRC 101105]GLX94549.1 lipoprotein [Herbidospora sp. NBRC 101105]